MNLIVVLYSVLFVQCASCSRTPVSKRNANYGDDEPWIWRDDVTTKKERKNISFITFWRDLEECNIDSTPKPNFRVPGRRISEAKCLEYIWERKHRSDRLMEIKTCKHRVYSEYGVETAPGAVGGRDAMFGEFPHMGGVGWRNRQGKWTFRCGCSLISSKFTLTAAHCSKSPPDPDIDNPVPEVVRLGERNIEDFVSYKYHPNDVKIFRIIVHPLYSAPIRYFDIALMEIEEMKSFKNIIQPACLWSQFDTTELGTSATLTGWGVVETVTKKTAVILQAAVVDIINSEECDNLLCTTCNRLWCGFADHQICAGKLDGGVDACQGDSGGPLQVKINLPPYDEGSMHYIIGVTSFGVGCALPNLPGVYTRVSSFIDWIETIVWPDNLN